jgi:hypothetical protein
MIVRVDRSERLDGGSGFLPVEDDDVPLLVTGKLNID